MIPVARAHRNCTFILPNLIRPKDVPGFETNSENRWMFESTHGCWCAAWQVQLDGSVLKWSHDRRTWEAPKPGEHYLTTNDPYDRR